MSKRNGGPPTLDAHRDPTTGRFLVGNTASLGRGRPIGSKTLLANEILKVLRDDWREHGRDVVERVRKTNPSGYLRSLVLLMRGSVTLLDENAELEQSRTRLATTSSSSSGKSSKNFPSSKKLARESR